MRDRIDVKVNVGVSREEAEREYIAMHNAGLYIFCPIPFELHARGLRQLGYSAVQWRDHA